MCRKHYQRWLRTGTPAIDRRGDLSNFGSARRVGNPGYRTDAPAYRTVHKRMGAASDHLCVDCGEQAHDWSYKHPTGYSADPADYAPRCRRCHKIHDRRSDAA